MRTIVWRSAVMLLAVMASPSLGQTISREALQGHVVEASPQTPDPRMTTPQWLGQQYVGDGNWLALDALVTKLAASGERNEDGRSQLFMLTFSIDHWLEQWDEALDAMFQSKFDEYEQQRPDSPFHPILAAMQVHATAWRARGRGYSNTVTAEGWRLSSERNRLAWKMMLDCKSRSSVLPTWYDQAIDIGLDAGAPMKEIAALFKEGINRYPGYHGIYFAMIRPLAPRWGGSYEAADAFIRKQVAASTNREGDVLYARLYWNLDQNDGEDPDFFRDSMADWSRMRSGFKTLMKNYPNSPWNRANFAAYACRVGDGSTYVDLRSTIDAGQFIRAAPSGISLEVCDARFRRKL